MVQLCIVDQKSAHSLLAFVNEFIEHKACIWRGCAGCVARLSVRVTRAAIHELMNQVENVIAGPRSRCCGSAVKHCQHQAANWWYEASHTKQTNKHIHTRCQVFHFSCYKKGHSCLFLPLSLQWVVSLCTLAHLCIQEWLLHASVGTSLLCTMCADAIQNVLVLLKLGGHFISISISALLPV